MTANYNISYVDATDGEITSKPLSIIGSFTAFDKIEDGNTDATIDDNSLDLSGVVGTDEVTLNPVVEFASADPGTDITVSITASSTLTGTASDNYSIDLTGAPTTTADILEDLTPVITDLNGDPAPDEADEGEQLTYKVTDRGAGFTYAWSFVENTTTNEILFASGNQVEVEWNEDGTLKVTETYDNGVDTPVVRTADLAVTVNRIPLKGTVQYNRNSGSHTPLQGITVKLIPVGGGTTLETQTDATGYYAFDYDDVQNGQAYTLEISTTMEWGGGNSTDALAIQRRQIGSYPSFYDPANTDFAFRDKVADANANSLVNATDALLVKRRAIQLVSSFAAGDWAFYIPGTPDQFFTNTDASTATLSYTHDQANPAELNILAMVYGDVNSSYNPAPPAKSFVPVSKGDITPVNHAKMIYLPVRIVSEDVIGAVTLKLKYDDSFIRVKGLKSNVNGLVHHIADGHINVAWSDVNGLNLPADGTLFTLVLDAVKEVNYWQELFSIESSTQFADVECMELNDVQVVIDQLQTKQGIIFGDSPEAFSVSCYPNPFRDVVNISYALPERGIVQIIITNSMGEQVLRLEDQTKDAGNYTQPFNPAGYSLPKGIYNCMITVKGISETYRKVERIVYVK
jgi:hypothetical protein